MPAARAAPSSTSVVLQAAALICVAFVWIDALIAPERLAEAASVRLATAVVVLLIGRLMGGDLERIGLLLAGACGVAMAFALSVLEGGSHSPLFPWLVALPLLFPAVLVTDRRPLIAISVLCLVGIAAVLVAEERSIREIAAWLGSGSAASVFAVVVGQRVTNLQRSHAESEMARKLAQAQLAESEHKRELAERLAIVGRLAAGVSHEINNPLAYVKGNIELVQAQLEGTPTDMLADALDGVARIQQIVSDLKGISRLEPGPVEMVVVGDMVARAVHVLGQRLARVRIELDVPEDLAVLCGVGRLEQVLLNVIANAADALGESCRGLQPLIRIEASAEGGRARIVVDDNGPGLERVEGHLFEPFFTTKPRGTGLGLALSREYVEAAGGVLRAAVAPSGGARFVIELPAAPAEERRLPIAV